MRKVSFGLATVVALSAPICAHAASIDFTDRSVWSSASSTATVAGALVSLSSNPAGAIKFNQDFDGAPAQAPFCGSQGGSFACVSDGLGVRDDEITSTPSSTESVTVTFGRAVRIIGLAFLDLFIASDGGTLEVANVAFDGGPVSLSVDATEMRSGSGNPGFRSVAVGGTKATSITFTAGLSNDNAGRADFALAGIEVAPVPLPAAGLMLAGALGGMALLRRKRSAAI